METRVPIILNDKVRLKNLTARLKNELENEGYEVVPDGYGHPSVKFNPEPKNILENNSLISILGFLAKHGVAFETDFKQAYSPADTIKIMRENGLYSGPIIECGFNGKDWTFREV